MQLRAGLQWRLNVSLKAIGWRTARERHANAPVYAGPRGLLIVLLTRHKRNLLVDG